MNDFFSDNYRGEIYNAAIYCRLSSEDDDKPESNSIGNQKSILTKYVMEKGWNMVDIYVDDGFTGLNFDRPGFNRMLEDINDGKISLVITKDMSRLGRDYIDVGYYIEKFFPENNIRFIALNDNIDTEKDKGNNDIAPFKAVINDMYSKDISKKVRSVFDLKRKEGKYIGAFAPYGYEKDPNDNNKLVVDKNAAGIVRRIFELYLSDNGIARIAKILNSEGIKCPSVYKKKKYGTYNNAKSKMSIWCAESVKSILINPVYTGSITQNKCKKVNYKSKKVRHIDKKDWIIVEDTHEPIVTKDEFEQIQDLLNYKGSDYTLSRKASRLFSGFTHCGDCGQLMTYYTTRSGYLYLICSSYKRYGKHVCTRHSILEKDLEQMILQDLRKMFHEFADKENLEENAKKIIAQRKNVYKLYKDEMMAINRRLEEIKNTLMNLYQDKVKGIINEEQFIDFNKRFNDEKLGLDKRFRELDNMMNPSIKNNDEEDKIKKLVSQVIDIEKLNRAIIYQLIHKIEVFENQDVKVHYKFKNPYEA